MERLTKLNIEAIRNPNDAAIRDSLAEICKKLGKQDLSIMWRRAAEACRQFGVRQQRSVPIRRDSGTRF